MTRLQEKIYARRYQRMANFGDKVLELIGTTVVAFALSWFVVNAFFPNTPL